jgi:hypothetical protein
MGPTKLFSVRPRFLHFPRRRIRHALHVRQISRNGTNPSTFAISPPLAELTDERREPPEAFGDAQPFRFGNSGQSRCDLEGHGRVLLADSERVIAGTNLSDYQK